MILCIAQSLFETMKSTYLLLKCDSFTRKTQPYVSPLKTNHICMNRLLLANQ